jgi:hypothetical protein
MKTCNQPTTSSGNQSSNMRTREQSKRGSAALNQSLGIGNSRHSIKNTSVSRHDSIEKRSRNVVNKHAGIPYPGVGSTIGSRFEGGNFDGSHYKTTNSVLSSNQGKPHNKVIPTSNKSSTKVAAQGIINSSSTGKHNQIMVGRKAAEILMKGVSPHKQR